MTKMNISLPDPLKQWVVSQVRDGRYGSASEYVQDLIERDRERQAQSRIERLAVAGLESGPAEEMTDADSSQLRSRLTKRDKTKPSGDES